MTSSSTRIVLYTITSRASRPAFCSMARLCMGRRLTTIQRERNAKGPQESEVGRGTGAHQSATANDPRLRWWTGFASGYRAMRIQIKPRPSSTGVGSTCAICRSHKIPTARHFASARRRTETRTSPSHVVGAALSSHAERGREGVLAHEPCMCAAGRQVLSGPFTARSQEPPGNVQAAARPWTVDARARAAAQGSWAHRAVCRRPARSVISL